MKLRFGSALAATLVLLSGIAVSAQVPVEPERQPVVPEGTDDITVTGQRREALRMIMQGFITEIGDPVSRSRGYARWRGALCVGVTGISDPGPAQFLIDRISSRALENGLRPEEPGCQPTVLVIFTADGRGTATQLVAEAPLAFRPFGGTGGTTQGFQALDDFQATEAPVRWWQVMAQVDELGNLAMTTSLTGEGGLPTTRGMNSRIRDSISEALWSCLIIVDTRKLDGLEWAQLGDYLAMVALAQVKPDSAPADYDSILNLFRVPNPPPAMTEMDLNYLHALYEMDNMLLPRMQRRVFANEMLEENESAQ